MRADTSTMPGKVLVVDDDAVNRELLEEVLVAEGLEVVTAPDGRSTLQEFSRLKPDLVLLDVTMPFTSPGKFRKRKPPQGRDALFRFRNISRLVNR